MFVHRSNRSERLVDALAAVVKEPLPDPLTPELVVVHSKGMERWLTMQLSQRLGVFANAQFPFPRHLFERLFDTVLGDEAKLGAAFDERVSMWSIAALLPNQLQAPAFEPIARYLARDVDGCLHIALAQRIARVFDDYAVYRPELLLGWERGEEQSWEAQLWRALCARDGRGHQPARAQRFIRALDEGRFPRDALPARICLFGMSSLPPLYLSLLSALAPHVPIHLFVLSPSREYFGDVRRRPNRVGGDDGWDDADGHPLLASLGRLGREFQALLEERTHYVEASADLYEDPGTGTLLHTLQSDMLELRNRGHAGGEVHRAALSPADTSISIHVCHSRVRELEVLHDQLVALLEDERLQPHQIVVMAPDIEAYAPAIEAVFGSKAGRPELPYSVADRKTRATHPVVDALYALLGALQGRLSAGAVLDLLSLDCIRQRFRIQAEDMELLRAWIEDSGIRWGVDGADRVEVGQPKYEENTWRHGLDRMLLGYAMQPEGQRMYANLLPFEAAEGGAAELLGKLAEACERLFAHRTALRGVRPLAGWRDALLCLIDELIDDSGEHAHEHLLIRAALDRLTESSAAGGFHAPLHLRSVEAQLERALDERMPARGLLARGITFCQLVPMRGIPFEVVCLIGMNDDAFPARHPSLGFDRMGDPSTRVIGDRNRREDDRYLFLEALLCARHRLLVSYIGRGVRDNRVLPPSVMVGELLDAIEHGFETGDGGRAALERRLCVVHRLHAFSPRYFEPDGDPRLFSFAALACDAARALGRERSDPVLLAGSLPTREPLREISIDELVSWVALPVRTFLQRKLGLYLGGELAALPAREPLDLGGLDRWQLGTHLLSLAVRGGDLPELVAVARGAGQLPLGNVGAVTYEELWPEVQELARAAARHRGGEAVDPLGVEIEVGEVRLTGTLHDLWPATHLHASFSRLGRRFELGHFVRHLVLRCWKLQNAARSAQYPERSVVVARSADGEGVSVVEFGAIADPERILADLLEMVQAAQSQALPFVHDVSRAYCEALQGGSGDRERSALIEAQRRFEDERGFPDPYVKLVYRDFAALSEAQGALSFQALAQRVLGPMLSSRRSIDVPADEARS